MANGMLLGFLAVATVVVGGLDYTMQTRRADLAFGELGVGAYVASFGERFAGMKAEQAAAAEASALRRQDPRTLLPEAPEGWVMREWNEGDRARLFPSRELFTEDEDKPAEFAEIEQALMDDPQFRAMAEAGERMQVAKEKAEIRFYQRGDSLIALELNYNRQAGGVGLNGPLGSGTMQNAAMDIVVGNMTAMSARDGFAVVGGVPFGQSLGMFGMVDPDADPTTSVRVFRGKMGPELTITARAMAPDQHVKDLLAQIDFDTLNKILTTPLPGVGSEAPAIAPEDERAIATAAVEAEAQALIARGRESEAELVGAATALNEGDGAGLFGLMMRQTSEARAAAEAEEAAAAATPPAEGSLAALMEGNAPAEAAPTDSAEQAIASAGAEPAAAITPASPPVEVRVRRAGVAGGENCTMTATGKRCSLLGN
ncbi:MAG: hypothetical protein RLZZ437_818 [Pseudomonadota bacterium]|jgi:hypothetical protein